MAEQIVDRPAGGLPSAAAVGGGSLASSPAPALGSGWRCLPGAVIRAYGDEGPVDLAALHPAHGVALIAFLDEGQEASPDEARDALRAMLHHEGLPRLFPGELPIVALPVPRAARAQLAGIVEHAFSGMPAPTLAPGWLDWLSGRLAAEPPAPAPLLAPRRDEPRPQKLVSALLLTTVAEAATTAAPRLVAPRRDEAPDKLAGGIALGAPGLAATKSVAGTAERETAAPSEASPSEAPPRANWLDWGATLGFALGMVAALIAGLTAVLRNGRLF